MRNPQFDFYELIHHGDSSKVYRGIRKADTKNVIIKLFNSEQSSYFREFQIADKIRYSGIIDVLSFEKSDGKSFIVMEDFGGVSLNNVDFDFAENLDTFINLSISIAKSINEIHKHYVIHKDINPSNIVWSRESGVIKIIDFGISTELSRERINIDRTEIIEGTLSYISPEQTGRINRSLDYRTDYYSLGITLYQLLTGKLPFIGEDSLEIIYNHITQEPVPPRELIDLDAKDESYIKKIETLSDIILKLISKSSYDRYQSLNGLIDDLTKCRGNIDVIIGQNDYSEQFKVPELLLGREAEVELLYQSLNNLRGGDKQLVLISGEPGVGKSALIDELEKPAFECNAYFFRGKYDQYNQDRPFYAFILIFKQFIKQILIESEYKISLWREKFREVLGDNGQIIIELIPEMKLIIGEQKQLPELTLLETKNRFKNTITSFVKVITYGENPLVIFIDDLQWIDNSSLDLIELIMNDVEISGLLLIGAYRDNEVDSMHPLSNTIKKLNQNSIKPITLNNLTLESIRKLSALTLYRDESELTGFSELILYKTNGNPFFTIQLLNSLYKDEIINFNNQLLAWDWEHRELELYEVSDNIVDLMVEKIKLLPDETQKFLQLASAIGNKFDLSILSAISGKSRDYISKTIWDGLKEGIIEPCDIHYKYVDEDENELNPGYRFIHDKVQQAAYSMLSDNNKTEAHIKIARIINDDIFTILSHYNKAFDYITDKKEIEKVYKLNYRAGDRALKSNAYDSALYHFELALNLFDQLDKRPVEEQLKLYIQIMESSYYCSEFDRIEEISKDALKVTSNKIDEAKIYEIIMNAYYTQERVDDIINIGIDVLKKFGISIPNRPRLLDVVSEYFKTLWKLRTYSIDDLYNLKIMDNSDSLAICRLLSVMISSAYVSRPDISPILSLKLVQMSIKYGNYPHSQIYPFFGLLHLIILNRADMCFEYGELGLKLSKKEEFSGSRTQNLLMFYAFNYHWKRPITETIDSLLEGYNVGIINGDIEYACWSLHCSDFAAFFSGNSLDPLYEKMVNHRKKMIKHKQFTILNIFSTVLQSLSNLKNEVENPSILSGEFFDDKSLLESLEGSTLRTTKASIYFWRVVLCYMFDDFESSILNAVDFEELLDAHAGLSSQPFFYFIHSLALLRVINSKSRRARLRVLRKVKKNQRLLNTISKNAPENHKFKWILVEAELCRVNGKISRAQKLYEKALTETKINSNRWMRAIAYETYANFYLNSDRTELANHFLQKAHASYSVWGAKTKVKHMESKYTNCTFNVKRAHLNTSVTSSSSSTKTLDLLTVFKVSNLISGEMNLEKLLNKLMMYLIENAGAQKAVILLHKDNVWSLEASIEQNRSNLTVLQNIPVFQTNGEELEVIDVNDNNLYSLSIVKYVILTKTQLILDNAAEAGDFIRDEYILRNSSKSILCLPLLNQGKLNGLIYLENSLSSNIFSADRIEVLNMISSNVSIAIENARMYREVNELNKNLELKVKERTIELEKQSITDRLTGLYNRYKIERVLENEYHRAVRYKSTYSIIIIDIDHFKLVNDNFGHQTGDIVLREFSTLLKNSVRSVDTVGRWGGEEFVVISPESDLESAKKLAEKLRSKVELHTFPVVKSKTISLGVATSTVDETTDGLIKRADDNLYNAKKEGRNRVCW